MNKWIITAIVAVAATGLTSFAKDKEAKSGEKKHESKCPYTTMMEKYDTNKDGKIDDTEKAAMSDKDKARLDKMLAKYDANKDGKIDDTELAAMKAAHDTHHTAATPAAQ